MGSGTMSADDLSAGFIGFPGFFELRPSLVGPTLDGGSIYRSFFASWLFQPSGLPVTEVCTQTGTSQQPFIAGFFGGRRNTELGLLAIEADGVSIDETWVNEDATYQLNLQGVSE